MGAGKTTAGRKLAARFGYRFVDLDKIIEEEEGVTVRQLFDTHGEEYFRQRESSLLKTLSLQDNLVISTGGGTPCFYDNMEMMKSRGITVYIRMSPEALFHRLKMSRSGRPLIRTKSGNELLDYIRHTLHFREPYYLKAHIVTEGKDLDLADLSSRILDFSTK